MRVMTVEIANIIKEKTIYALKFVNTAKHIFNEICFDEHFDEKNNIRLVSSRMEQLENKFQSVLQKIYVATNNIIDTTDNTTKTFPEVVKNRGMNIYMQARDKHTCLYLDPLCQLKEQEKERNCTVVVKTLNQTDKFNPIELQKCLTRKIDCREIKAKDVYPTRNRKLIIRVNTEENANYKHVQC